MKLDRIRQAEQRIEEAQQELQQWEARLAELDELFRELDTPVTLARAHEIWQRCDLRERRQVEAEVRAARSRVREARQLLTRLRWTRNAA